MARRERAAVYPWVSLGGSARRYWNPNTGETISRERYDSLYGSLFRRGARSYKRASAAVPEELRLSRPARGRGSKARREGGKNIKGLRPLTGKQSRNVNIPFDVYYEGDEGDVYEQTEDYRDGYDEAVELVHGNPRVSSVSLIITYENTSTGKSGYYTIVNIRDKLSIPTYDEFLADLFEKSYPGDQLGPITFHLRFFGWATVAKTKPSKPLKLPKGYKVKRK